MGISRIIHSNLRAKYIIKENFALLEIPGHNAMGISRTNSFKSTSKIFLRRKFYVFRDNEKCISRINSFKSTYKILHRRKLYVLRDIWS